MTINKTSWHARIYRWWRYKKFGTFSDVANLCPYVRVVLFWAPLRWLLRSGKIGPVHVPILTSIGLVGGSLLLPGLYAWVAFKTIIEILGLLLVAVVCTLVFGVLCYLDERKKGWAKRFLLVRAGSSFWTVLKAYSRATHDRICPELYFDK